MGGSRSGGSPDSIRRPPHVRSVLDGRVDFLVGEVVGIQAGVVCRWRTECQDASAVVTGAAMAMADHRRGNPEITLGCLDVIGLT